MSNYEIYKGESEGFKSLTDGYMEYGIETIKNRAIPDLRDGLKPVNRRTLYAISEGKNKSKESSATIVGKIMNYHPHGDQSIYDSFCRLVDKAEYSNVPLLEGSGNFSKVYLADPPAAMRYTYAKPADIFYEFFQDMEGCNMVLDEKGEGLEPEVLPVTFPYLLVSGSNGMAVAIANNLPSYNFWDVLNLLEKGLSEQSFTEEDIIVPDFPTGGYIVNDIKEFANIMFTGKGKFKLRADVEVDGKDIKIKEVPYGRIVNTMKKKIQKMEIPGVSSIFEATDHKSEQEGTKIEVTCTSKTKVEEVLMTLYRRGIAQNTFNANVTVINGDVPVKTGVFGLIREWIKWRKSVIVTKFKVINEGLLITQSELSYFLKLIQYLPNRDKFIDLMVNKSNKEAIEFLISLFPEIKQNEIDFILDRKLAHFNKANKYVERYENITKQIEENNEIIAKPEIQIQKDIDRLRIENKGKYQRKTKITTKDYKFSKISDSGMSDDSPCTYVLGDTMVNKYSYNYSGVKDVIDGKSNDVFVGFDSLSRGVRFYGSDISEGRSVKLNDYFGVSSNRDSYSVPLLTKPVNELYMLVYSDGYCSFFNPSKLEPGTRRVTIVKDVVPAEVSSKLTHIVHQKDFNDFLILRRGTQVGIVAMESVKVKCALSRTFLINTDGPIETIELRSKEWVFTHYPNYLDYAMKLIEDKGIFNDEEEVIENGTVEF